MFEHDILYRQILDRQQSIRQEVRTNQMRRFERQSLRTKLASYLYRVAERLETSTDSKRVLGTR